VTDGQTNEILFNDNIDNYKYLERRGWIRFETINRMLFIFFTPEAERLFFSGNPPDWASVQMPSEEEKRRGYNRRSLTITLARLEFMHIADVSSSFTPDMNRLYTVTALWRWKPTEIGREFIKQRPFQLQFALQQINGMWEVTPRGSASTCVESPFYGILSDSTLTIEPSTIMLAPHANDYGGFNLLFNNHNLADVQQIRIPCRMEDISLGQPEKGEYGAYIYPSLKARAQGGETTLICSFQGFTAIARVVIAPPLPPPPLTIEPAIIETRVGQTVPYLVLSNGKNIAGLYTEGSWFLRCAVADRNIARSERRRDREELIGLRPGETTLTCINKGANQTLPSQTGTVRVIVK